jgi:hypothetical protein
MPQKGPLDGLALKGLEPQPLAGATGCRLPAFSPPLAGRSADVAEMAMKLALHAHPHLTPRYGTSPRSHAGMLLGGAGECS